jgi:hypothetical protein
LRRFIVVITAAAVLLGAVAAYAASSDFNTYTASLGFAPGKAGTPAKPSPYAMREVWTAKGTNGHQAGPLTRIVRKIYGVRWDGKDFPVCTAKMINDAGSKDKSWNKVCPKGSLLGGGPVNALFVPANNPNSAGVPCNPYETVYNGGQGKRTIFFEEAPFAPGPQYTCAGGAVQTGAAAAYTETYSVKGGATVLDAPQPPATSTAAGGLPGVYSALLKLDLKFPKLTKKVKGKTVSYQSSVACKAGKRPYSLTFTAQNYAGQSPPTQTTTISHKVSC